MPMKKEYRLDYKQVVLEYRPPYVITPLKYSPESVIVLENEVPLYQIYNPDFVLQIGDNDFVFTNDTNSDNEEREVSFKHVSFSLKEKPNCFFSQVRKIASYSQFPLERVGNKFKIPAYFRDGSDSIYDANSKYYFDTLFKMRETLKIQKIKLQDTDFFKVVDQVYIGENESGEVLENFTSILRESEKSPNSICNSNGEMFPLCTQKDYDAVSDYIRVLRENYERLTQVKKEQQESILQMLLCKK